MAYARAVWIENNEEYEQTIPSCWINDSLNIVYWPNGLQVKRAFMNLEPLKSGCSQFRLIKRKLEGSLEFCEGASDYTTSEEIMTSKKVEKSVESNHGRLLYHYFSVLSV
ncbi:uncharacterized protein LOC136094235 [Hydra vulgaris]|uniref:uncharacterized protein LOC136094235 n=1 Tax=Hydra vulgaris TaxID=6087 RepID=UPI0032EA248F